MKRDLVCIVIKSEASTLRSTLSMASLLTENGYDVHYVGLFDDAARQFIEAQGFVASSFLDLNEYARLRQCQLEKLSEKESYRLYVDWQHALIQDCYLQYCEAPPSLVLFEILNTTWTTPFVRMGVPLLAFSVTMSVMFNPSVPSVHSNFVPARNPVLSDKISIVCDWLRQYRRQKVKDIALWATLRKMFWNSRIPTIPYKQIFRRAGYKIQWGDFLGNDIRIKVPTVVLSPAELDFPQAKALPNRFYAGTSVQASRQETEFDWSAIAPGRKNIYATLGSLSAYCGERYRKNFYRAVIGAVPPDSDYNLILQVGNRADLEGIALQENMYVYDWIPHLELFKNVELIVCHAGLGTLREAIYNCVPTVVMPWGGDQPGNAARIVYHNLGVRNNFFTVTAADLSASIRKIESDASICQAVKKFQRDFRNSEQSTLGISFFEQFMKKTDEAKRAAQSFRKSNSYSNSLVR